jgi:hypothetical protein
METFQLKVGRNQFRCFHCRLIFAQKDGDWFDWDQMQVHLCRTCDKLTENRPQRLYKTHVVNV